MRKKLLPLILSVVFIFSFSFSAFAVEPDNFSYKTSVEEFVYADFDTIQKHREDLYERMVDPGKALGLSALYFGLGQIYAGDTTRGGLILAGGTLLAGTILIFLLPYVRDRQESVKNNGTMLSVLALGTAYIFNIRDAYITAENTNKRIQKELLLSEQFLKEAEKFSLSVNDKTEVSYRVYSF